eukprot:2122129-Heterocapsa_arctica.AAC.1
MASADMANSGQTRNQSNFEVVPSLLVKDPGSRFQSPPMIHGTLPIFAKCSDILAHNTLCPSSAP